MMKRILISLAIIFALIVGLYVFNYEKAMKDMEFRRTCDSQNGFIIADEVGGKYCLRRNNEISQ
jgi:hypothetical protein